MGKKMKIPIIQKWEAVTTFEGAFTLLTKDVKQYKKAFTESLEEHLISRQYDDQFYRDTAIAAFIRVARKFCNDLEQSQKDCDNIMSQVDEILYPNEDDLEEVDN